MRALSNRKLNKIGDLWVLVATGPFADRMRNRREFIIGSAVKETSCVALIDSAPLLEKERNALLSTLLQ